MNKYEVKYETQNFRVKKYFDINSTFRDRITNPSQANFVVSFTNNGQRGNAFTARDPIIAGVPSATGFTQLGSSNFVVKLDPALTSTVDNFYVNDVLQVTNGAVNAFATIIGYTGASHWAIPDVPYTGITVIDGLVYQIRGAKPIYSGTTSSAGTSFLNLNVPALNLDGFYVGKYLRITTGVDAQQIRLITAYTGSSRTAFFQTPFGSPGVGSGDGAEVLEFTSDNVVPLLYSGSDVFTQPVCYRMRLISLSIPYLTLDVGYGGTIANYPFVYVKFSVDGDPSAHQTLYSNNPYAKGASFKVPITVPDYSGIVSPGFVVLSANEETQTIKFKPNSSLRFVVTLPTGEVLSFTTKDQYSPLAPNPLVQISATIEIERID